MKKKIFAIFCVLLAFSAHGNTILDKEAQPAFEGFRAQDMAVPLPKYIYKPRFIDSIKKAIDAKLWVKRVEYKEYEVNKRYYTKESLGTFYITAYCNCAKCCTYPNQPTASGEYCHSGFITTCASDTSVLPFGTIIEVDGRLYVCEDTGSAVKGNHIDLYFDSHDEVEWYGSNYQEIYIVEFPYGTPEYD